jgi:hypothetical protein
MIVGVNVDDDYCYGWGVACEDDEFGEGYYYKSNALPVRCVMD